MRIDQFFHPDFSKPLGDPLTAEAAWEGNVMVRRFAHGTIARFDTSTNTGQIDWGSFDTWLL